MRYSPTSLLVAWVLVCWPLRSPAAPEDPGSFAFKSASTTVTLEGAAIAVDVYWPDVSGSFPALVVGHGFARSKASFVQWGQELAKRGYVAVAPNFPGADHAKNGKVVSGLLAWLVTRGQTAGDALQGKVDGARRGVVGHSAGGLAAILAAAADPTIKVLVGLDPVDAGLAVAAAPQIKAPTVFIRAQPGLCNSNGNATTVFPQLGGPRWTLRIKAATHCDPEAPSDFLCGIACGGSDPERHKRFRRYAFAVLDHILACKPGLEPWLGGMQTQADTLVEDLSAAAWPPAGCAPGQPDGGLPSKDGGLDSAAAGDLSAVDLSAASDAMGADGGIGVDGKVIAADGAGAADGGSATTPQEGCDCTLSSESEEPGATSVFGVFLLLALMVRSRKRWRGEARGKLRR